MARRVLLGLAGILILLIGAAIIVPPMIDWSTYQKPAIDAVRLATGYDVTVGGRVSLRLLPTPALSVSDVSLRRPDQPAGKYLAKVERVSVSLALFPLMTGQVAVNHVDLIHPEIYVGLAPDNTPDWLMNKTQADTAVNQTTPSPTPAPAPANTFGAAFSLNRLTISKGQVHVTRPGENPVQIEIGDLEATARLGSLQGPFKVDADFKYNGVPWSVEADVAGLPKTGEGADVHARLTASKQDTSLTYDGQLTRHGDYGLQGKVEVKATHWLELARALAAPNLTAPDQPLSLTSTVTADSQNIVLDQLAVRYGDMALDGAVKLRLPDESAPPEAKPFLFARLSSSQMLDAEKLRANFGNIGTTPAAPPTNAAAKAASSPATANTFGAAPIKLPLDLDLEIKAPGLRLAKTPWNDIAVTATAKGDDLRLRAQVAEVPGGGRMTLSAWPGENGALMFDVDAAIADAGVAARDGVGISLPPNLPAQALRDLKAQAQIALTAQQVAIKSGTLRGSVGDVAFTGTHYRWAAGKEPARLNLTLGGASLDIDQLLGKNSEKSAPVPTGKAIPAAAKEAVQQAAAGLKLPFDLDASVSLGKLVAGGKTWRDVEIIGQMIGDRLQIDRLSVGDVAGLSVSGKGRAGSISQLSGLDLALTAQATDAAAAVKTFSPTIATNELLRGPGKLAVRYRGDTKKGDAQVDATLNGVTVGAAGPVADPLGTPQLEQMQVKLSAASAAQFMRALQPGFNATAPLQGPLEITAKAGVKGKAYSLDNLSGTAGTMRVTGNLAVDTAGARPKISGALALGDVPLDALMGVSRTITSTPAARPSAGSTPTAPPVPATGWSQEAINTAWMRTVDLDLGITAKSVTYRLWSIGSPSLSVALNDGALALRDAQGQLFGGTIKAAGQMTASAKGSGLTYNAKLDMNAVNARSLTNALMNANMNRFDGQLNLAADMNGQGTSPAALVGSLAGTASSGGKDITIHGIDVAKLVTWLRTDLKPSNALQGLNDSFSGNGSTVFATHTGAYTIRNGVVVVDKMLFDGDQASLDTTGNVALTNWTIDTNSTLQVKNTADVPAIPIKLKGSLTNPASSFGQGLFENYVQKQLEKKAGKLIDKKLGGKLEKLGLGGLLGGGAAEAGASSTNPASAPETTVTPSNTDTAPPATTTTPQQKTKPEDVLIDVLKGLGN